MSFKCMAWASEQKTGSSTKKLILLLLADRANDKGKCFPSHTTIANDSELSRITVIRNIKSLEEQGLLSIKNRSNNGKKTSNVYTLNINLDVSLSTVSSITVIHKPINNLYSAFFKKLWDDYLVFGKRKKFMVGNKQKAFSSYEKLVQKISDDEIYELVTLEADKEYAWRHLATILNEKIKAIG